MSALSAASNQKALDELLARVRACRHCPLPHEARPTLRLSSTARILIIGQAPGTRVHETGIPWNDASGKRLRDWTALDPEIFYDVAQIAIMPMGFCFPGQDAAGGDLPPRPECAPRWHDMLRAHMPELQLILLVGQYAQRRYLGKARKAKLWDTVAAWSEYGPLYFPLPHPSWRNTVHLKRHPFFKAALLPDLRAQVAAALHGPRNRRAKPSASGLADLALQPFQV